MALLELRRRKLWGQTPPRAFSHQPRFSQATAPHWENRSLPNPREKLWLDTNPWTSFVPIPRCFEDEMKRALGYHPWIQVISTQLSTTCAPVSTACSSELYSKPATSLKTFPLFKANIIAMKGSTSKGGFVFFLNLHK